MRKLLAICSLALLLLVTARSAAAQIDEKDAPAALIQATKFLEEKPFDKDAKNIRSWAITWVIKTDKVSVTVCSLLVSGVEKKYKYSGEIFGQYTIGMAAFKLSNPDKAGNEDAAQLAGIESALASYEAMIKEQPKAKNSFLDDLVAKRGAGSLAKYVAENNCKSKS